MKSTSFLFTSFGDAFGAGGSAGSAGLAGCWGGLGALKLGLLEKLGPVGGAGAGVDGAGAGIDGAGYAGASNGNSFSILDFQEKNNKKKTNKK